MKIYSEKENYKLYQGNMLDMLEIIKQESIDSIITDPPYELNFMGKGWDNAGVSFNSDTWKKCFDVLKPGGYLLAFGGTRTYHRIACAIEDAGFEIRDTIMWLYGSGFPKSMNIGLSIDKKLGIESRVIGKGFGNINAMPDGRPSRSAVAWDSEPKEYEIKEAQNEWNGWGTSLKPAYEPIIIARKPFKGTLVDNVLENGVGGLNIDECRVKFANKADMDFHKKEIQRVLNVNTPYNNSWKNSSNLHNANKQNEKGRFPANVILTYDETDFDEVCGDMPNTINKTKTHIAKNSDNNINFNASKQVNVIGYADSGSASRYFYCAKASKKDRDEGLDEFKEKTSGELTERKEDSAGITAFAGSRVPKKNIHPTVKPTSLMQYLVRLVSPKCATILDPFMRKWKYGESSNV